MPSGTPINKIPLLQTSLKNVLTIRATGTNTSFYETKLELWIDESGQLRIKDRSASSRRDSSPEEISLFDAATQAYGQTRGTVISEAAERDFDNPLRWYVSYFIAVSKTPLYGNVRFSPKREKIDPVGYDPQIEGTQITLKERNGRRIWENIRLKSIDLARAIERLLVLRGEV